MDRFMGTLNRILFSAAALLLTVGILEKLGNQIGVSLLRRQYDPWRLFELAAVLLLFVIAVELRRGRVAGSAGSP